MITLLKIFIEIRANTTYEIIVEYATNSETEAINWLTKEQTHDHSMPYMFTQC